jgi:protoheme IX farnesyltransferase
MKRIHTRVRDLLWLGKPGIALWCVLVSGGTAVLAGGVGVQEALGLAGWLSLLLGTGLTVMAAGGLNMVLERRADREMARTRNRPVAAGRVGAPQATALALAQAAAGLGLLVWGTRPLTAALAAAALVLYLGAYTPLKRHTRLAALVGTVPGAIPALLGWSAVHGDLAPAAWVVFAVLVLWQLPHTLVIMLRRWRDYAAVGVPTVPAAVGAGPARIHIFGWTALLFSVSLLLVPLGVAGALYFLVASLVGGWLVYLGLLGLEPSAQQGSRGGRWARRYFVATVLYVPALTAALVLDRLLG